MKERRTKRSIPSSYYEYDERNYRRSRLLVLIIFFLMVVGVVCFFYVSFVLRNIGAAYEPLVEVAASPAVASDRQVTAVLREGKPISLLWLGVDDSESGRLVSEETSLIAVSLLEAGDQGGQRLQIASESTLKATSALPSGPIGQVFLTKPLQSIQNATHELLNLPIDYTIEVKFSKLRPLIERLGGVTLVPTQDFTLENRLLPANQSVTLTAREVYLYVAKQSGETSLSQGRRQLDVLEGLINQLAHWQKVPQLDQEVSLLQEAIRTDMSFDDFLGLFRAGYFTQMTRPESLQVDLEVAGHQVLLQQLQQQLDNN